MDVRRNGSPLLRLMVSALFAATATGTWADSCDSPTAVALPMVLNGAGEFCRVTTGTINEFNSWEMELVEINGVPFTNSYWNKWSRPLPEKINGQYIIRYVGKYPWSHLELNGSGGSNNDDGSNDNGAPQGISVQLGAAGGNGKIDLSWTVTGDIRSIQVMRDTDADPAGRQRVAILSGKARSYTDTSVVSGRQYWYWIKYTDAKGKAGDSNASNATVGSNDQAIPVTSVTLTPTATVKVGATTTLTATVQPNNASNPAVTWSTSDATIATVSNTGVVTGKAKGEAIITVRTVDGNRTATSTVTVTADQQTIPVTSVALTPTATVKVGVTTTLTATVQPNNASNPAVTWSTSDATIATISNTGVVTGKAKGEAIITVKTVDGNRTATSTVTVTADQQTIPVTSVTLTPTATVKVGATTTLTATVQPNNASNPAVTWSTSDATIATVSNTGVVTGKAKGEAIITVKTVDGNRTATSTVTVTADVQPDPTQGMFRVNASGNITKNGAEMPIQCGAWFGLEGQHEPPNATNNPGGAPMELYVGNMWWNPTGRTIQQTMTEIKDQGFNVIRFPIAPQTLDPTDPQGMGWARDGGALKNHPSVQQQNARQALEDFIKLADKNGIDLIIDIHSCSNYVGWRAGRLDSKPPYVDANRPDYIYTREEHSCSATGNPASVKYVRAYNKDVWLSNLREIAGLQAKLGVKNILAIDIFNEPWDYSWSEWKSLAESAYQAINEVNKDVLIMVEGIGSVRADGTKVPFGDEAYNPNWGENLYSAAEAPLNIPKDRLVFSPHTYGPSVYVQKQFLDPSQPECVGLEGDAAGNARCNIAIDAATLRAGWDQHFGYLRDQGYGMIVGEFGGSWDWPRGASQDAQSRWSHLPSGVDAKWQNAFVDYAIEKKMNACYWSINPESADTGGLYGTAYVAGSNESGWGTWTSIDTRRMDLLKRFWRGNK